MANKRDLKKDINYVFGDIIEEVYVWELDNPKKDNKKGEAIIDEAIKSFDELIERVNDRSIENPSKHFKAIRKDLEKTAQTLVDKVNAL